MSNPNLHPQHTVGADWYQRETEQANFEDAKQRAAISRIELLKLCLEERVNGGNPAVWQAARKELDELSMFWTGVDEPTPKERLR
jgi:hypothetical protein